MKPREMRNVMFFFGNNRLKHKLRKSGFHYWSKQSKKPCCNFLIRYMITTCSHTHAMQRLFILFKKALMSCSSKMLELRRRAILNFDLLVVEICNGVTSSIIPYMLHRTEIGKLWRPLLSVDNFDNCKENIEQRIAVRAYIVIYE